MRLLQHYCAGVRDTLVSLGEAGIAVWILTGDKKETAINISYACGHLQPGLTVLDLTGLTNITATPKVMFKYHKISPDDQILGK